MTRLFAAMLALLPAVVPAAVFISSPPEGEPLSDQYEVFVNGKPVPVYVARVLDAPFAGNQYDFGGPYSFATFDADCPVEVAIRSPRSLDRVVLRPETPGVTQRPGPDKSLVVSLPAPCKLSIEPDGKKSPLLLFVNAPENQTFTASQASEGLIYFGPGIHRPGKISLHSGQTLYLAPGSLVKGGILAEGENIRITGRGILDASDYEWRKGPTPHVISICGTNVEVSGIIIRGASHWTIVPRHSRNILVRNVKICGSRVQNDDGINPCNSQDVLITDCFIRSDDDCVALKGIEQRGPDSNVERITVENSILWCDRARIFLLGHESRADFMRDVVLRNIDIIHYSMTPFLFEPGEEMRLQNVLVENVRLHGEGQGEAARLQPVVNQYMRNQVPGHISDVTFRNIRLTGAPGGYRVQVRGADSQHLVRNVCFDNVEILGSPLSARSQYLESGPHAGALRFGSTPTLTISQPDLDGEFPGWRAFHETASAKTADVWRRLPDDVIACLGQPRGYLFSERSFTNCIVRLEWRYPAQSSNAKGGILVRMSGDHAIWPKCLEFQLNQGQAGDFWAIRDFLIEGPAPALESIPKSDFGYLRHLKRFADAELPPGHWNVFEGIVDGSTAVQKVNGRTVSLATGCELSPGKILITSEGQPIEFRNVEVLSLDD